MSLISHKFISRKLLPCYVVILTAYPLKASHIYSDESESNMQLIRMATDRYIQLHGKPPKSFSALSQSLYCTFDGLTIEITPKAADKLKFRDRRCKNLYELEIKSLSYTVLVRDWDDRLVNRYTGSYRRGSPKKKQALPKEVFP